MAIRRLLAVCILMTVVSSAAWAGGPKIWLNYASFDPLAGEPAIPGDLRAALVQGEEDYFLVQFDGPVEDGWKAQLLALGLSFDDYIPDFAFLVRMTPERCDAVRALAHVRWVGPYHPAYRIDRSLLSATQSVRASIVTFAGKGPDRVAADVRRLGGVADALGGGRFGARVDVTMPARDLRKLARGKDVAWIERRAQRKFYNDVARGLMSAPAVWSGASLYGSGEIVGVCDTGLDTGNLNDLSADFAGRVLATYALGRNGNWSDGFASNPPPNHPAGHGTHVAGSVLGSGVLSGSNPTAHSYSGSFAGIAPEAQLVFQSVMDSSGGLGGLPAKLSSLFQDPYNNGARIHTNSWGSDVSGAYTSDSREVDQFAWSNRDMTILFSAGNAGTDANANGVIDPDSIGSPGTAKNCITVGASESYRLSGGLQGTWGGYWASDYAANPVRDDKVSNNSTGLAAFSSRGPTNDGRIKPDIIAPGTNIISCRSHAPNSIALWGAYSSNYVYSGGTSMSTPLTAGAAALVRQFYRTQRDVTPSSALVKATLINGATDIYPGQYGTGSYMEIPIPRPNNAEGWGLVNLAYSLAPPPTRGLEFVENALGLSTSQSATYSYTVSGPTSPLRITLVWTDYAASTAASKTLVNDLDLVVITPSGAILHGNGATDRLNNVEGVDIASPAGGSYTIQVYGYNVGHGPQPFALVSSGAFGSPLPPPPAASISRPTPSLYLSGSVAVRGTASGDGFQQYVLEYGSGSAPTSWLPIGTAHTSPVVDGVLGSWDTSLLPDGAYTIRLTATGTGGLGTSSVTVTKASTTISAIKDQPDGTFVTLTGRVVTSGATELNGAVYIQDLSRISGIRVNIASVPADATVGKLVTVVGTLGTVNGERVVVAAQVVVTGP